MLVVFFIQLPQRVSLSSISSSCFIYLDRNNLRPLPEDDVTQWDRKINNLSFSQRGSYHISILPPSTSRRLSFIVPTRELKRWGYKEVIESRENGLFQKSPSHTGTQKDRDRCVIEKFCPCVPYLHFIFEVIVLSW